MATLTSFHYVNEKTTHQVERQCKICLLELSEEKTLACQCKFCEKCLYQYLSYEITNGTYDITCPDNQCGDKMQIEEMEQIVGSALIEKHRHFRLNTEVILDPKRVWCPKANCNTICHICQTTNSVTCPQCQHVFCSKCLNHWHPHMSCQTRESQASSESSKNQLPENIKRCPKCQVPIERLGGCAHIMCKSCKCIFCWFCQNPLPTADLLYLHYQSGPCKGKSGVDTGEMICYYTCVLPLFFIGALPFFIFGLAAIPFLIVYFIVHQLVICAFKKFVNMPVDVVSTK